MFTLDDIDYLVISFGRTRLDSTDEYDISYYENYVKENVKIIGELLEKVLSKGVLIKDNKTKIRVLSWAKKFLAKMYEQSQNKKPRIEYENSSPSPGLKGYFESHKYSYFIGRDLPRFVKSYSNIINFMNHIYLSTMIAERKGEIEDSKTLYDIFVITKKACSNLGIHCPSAPALYESITEDPYVEKSELLDMDVEIDESNSLEHDVMISSLPYTVTIPEFTDKGVSKYEISVTKPSPKIYYNESYFNKMPTKQ